MPILLKFWKQCLELILDLERSFIRVYLLPQLSAHSRPVPELHVLAGACWGDSYVPTWAPGQLDTWEPQNLDFFLSPLNWFDLCHRPHKIPLVVAWKGGEEKELPRMGRTWGLFLNLWTWVIQHGGCYYPWGYWILEMCLGPLNEVFH